MSLRMLLAEPESTAEPEGESTPEPESEVKPEGGSEPEPEGETIAEWVGGSIGIAAGVALIVLIIVIIVIVYRKKKAARIAREKQQVGVYPNSTPVIISDGVKPIYMS